MKEIENKRLNSLPFKCHESLICYNKFGYNKLGTTNKIGTTSLILTHGYN